MSTAGSVDTKAWAGGAAKAADMTSPLPDRSGATGIAGWAGTKGEAGAAETGGTAKAAGVANPADTVEGRLELGTAFAAATVAA
ncbi:hypothetical protein Ssi02_01760 [Sinosporangium siamense]|uniref:Uncharacterized protein n=1 Tax=Sinosporangium siamense TaxID=1367973 RepID=A0A919RBX6_9ACTN|nr:hypothetical protein Ssi02_01760 [Sinosporangium siamense]